MIWALSGIPACMHAGLATLFFLCYCFSDSCLPGDHDPNYLPLLDGSVLLILNSLTKILFVSQRVKHVYTTLCHWYNKTWFVRKMCKLNFLHIFKCSCNVNGINSKQRNSLLSIKKMKFWHYNTPRPAAFPDFLFYFTLVFSICQLSYFGFISSLSYIFFLLLIMSF